MSTRAYLSIGDVLTLLREEFPDVTISKIRFLESQGLVNPERSPSGYRKFYEQDVERLRWVLRQQREHFLPLKVIRDRLAREEGGEAVDGIVDLEPPAGPAAAPVPVAASVGARANPLAAGDAVRAPGPASAPGAASRQGHGNGVQSAARVEDAARARPVGAADGPAGRSGAPAGSDARRTGVTGGEPLPGLAGADGRRVSGEAVTDPARPARAAAGGDVGAVPAVRAAGPTGRPAGSQPPLPAAPPARSGAASAPTATGSDPSAAKRAPQAVSGGSGQWTGQPAAAPAPASGEGPDGRYVASAAVSGASLTLEELCAASGLSVTEIASVEGFGLIEPMTVAGVLYYDEEALVVAKLVAEFGRFGIEPRHLRLYRNAVDREVGLVEQIVTPLLRQRNPEARQRALDAAADLAKLGQGLRASLLRRELRRQLGS